MEYRKLGRTGLEVSAVGLGTEYLINLPREHVVAVVREAIEQDVNYFDLFFAQPEFRDNMGEAFSRDRERVMLAAHLGATWVDDQGDRSRDPAVCEQYFHDFLGRFRTDYVDVLMLHNCDEQDDYDQLMRSGGPVDLARRYKQQGKARFIGYSGHTVETSLQAVRSRDIDVLMYPVNLAGHSIPGRNELFSECVARGVGLVAMKTYAGGKLLQEWQRLDMHRFYFGGESREFDRSKAVTPVQCMAYTLAQVGVATVVPGCADLDQLSDTLAWLTATDGEKDFSDIVADFREYVTGECVYCNHCLPCPSSIDIGHTIRLLETARGAPSAELRAEYDAMPSNASDCTQCGQCEERCPFGVETMSKMAQAEKLFD